MTWIWNISQDIWYLVKDFPNIIKSPVHLRPYGLKEIQNTNPYDNVSSDKTKYTTKDFANAFLKSIGLGFDAKKMYEEIQIFKGLNGARIDIIGTDGKVIALPDLPNNLIYPNNNLYPSNKIFPINKKYSYLFFNYQIYQMNYTYSLETGEQLNEEIVDTGYTYSMVIPLNQENGRFIPVILYESEEWKND